MSIQNPQENPVSSTEELLDKAQKVLTPDQYARMEKSAKEKIGTLRLISMSLDELKAELPRVVAGDPDADDIMTRLDREFPGIKTPEEKPKVQEEKPKFTEHPWDWIKQKAGESGDWIYEKLPGTTDWKKAREKSKQGASGAVVAATAIFGESTGNALQSTEKAISWFDKLKSDPGKFFKELLDVLFSFDISRIKAFFSSTADSLGITSSMAENFAGMLGIPKDVMKYAKKLFSLDIFGKATYGDLSKVWEKYQKNPELDIMKELGIKDGTNTQVASVLESIFGKNSKDIANKFLDKSGKDTDITKVPMMDFISKLV